MINGWTNDSQVPSLSKLSTQILKDVREIGFKLFGPTIVFAFMQATGMINDHFITCPCFESWIPALSDQRSALILKIVLVWGVRSDL